MRIVSSLVEHCSLIHPTHRLHRLRVQRHWLGPHCYRRPLSTSTDFEDVSSSSKLGYGECSLCPFKIKVSPGIHLIQSTKPSSFKPCRRSKIIRRDSIIGNYEKLNRVTEIPHIAIHCVDEVLDTLAVYSSYRYIRTLNL